MSSTPSVESIRQVPKIELHLHLETSLRLRRLALHHRGAGRAVRQGGHHPVTTEPHLVADPGKFVGYDRLRRLRYASRAGKISDDLYSVANIEEITTELLAEAAGHSLRYVEIRVGGRQGFTLLGTRRMLEAMDRARVGAQTALGIRSGVLLTIVRERGPEEAEQRVREAIDCRDCGVVGVDLAGDEQNYPPALFARTLTLAREAGLGITVHAGEFAGPASIWTALYQLGALRIGHGVRAIEDPDLLAYLRDHHIALEICPTSNLRLGLSSSIRAHPVRQLVEAGVPVTINSDDPVLLGTDISRELHIVARALGLSLEGVRQFMVTAARAAFLPLQQRADLEEIVGSPLS